MTSGTASCIRARLFVVCDHGIETSIFRQTLPTESIERENSIELGRLHVGCRIQRIQELNGDVATIKLHAGVHGRQKSAAPRECPAAGRLSAIKHDKSRQILVLTSEPVGDPGSHARAPRDRVTRVRKVTCRRVIRGFVVHRVDEGQIIHTRRKVGKQAC